MNAAISRQGKTVEIRDRRELVRNSQQVAYEKSLGMKSIPPFFRCRAHAIDDFLACARLKSPLPIPTRSPQRSQESMDGKGDRQRFVARLSRSTSESTRQERRRSMKPGCLPRRLQPN
jgi:hypothetical protein